MWSNINGTYELEQVVGLENTFALSLTDENCSNARDDGILVEDSQSGCCWSNPDPPPDARYEIDEESEVYVSGMTVELNCIENRMQIKSITFQFCGCHRWNPGHAEPPVWDPWTCEGIPEYPNSYPYNNNLICELGTQEQSGTARPCTGDPMERPIIWPTIAQNDVPCLDPGDCYLEFNCATSANGKLIARLQC